MMPSKYLCKSRSTLYSMHLYTVFSNILKALNKLTVDTEKHSNHLDTVASVVFSFQLIKHRCCDH